MEWLKSKKFLLVSIGVMVSLITLPYIIARLSGGEEAVFSGFLMNPLDGNSYLVKMRQGFDGSWTFTLPYSHEPGDGVFLNMFYILLGHIARITTLPLIMVYHAARVAGAIFLSFTLWRVIGWLFVDKLNCRLAYLWAQFGLGLGWLALIFFPGELTDGLSTDLWVAEAFPFLSSFTNAHFPWGLGLMLLLLESFAFRKFEFNWRNGLQAGAAALLLSLIMPFGLPIVGVVTALVYFRRILNKESEVYKLLDAVPLLVGGGPMLLYYLYQASSHPVIKIWNSQNQTTSPNSLDLVFSFSPALIFAGFGSYYIIKKKHTKWYPLVIWLISGILLLYIPIGFQRRFISLLYFPAAVLAVYGLQRLFAARPCRFRLAWFGSFALSLITVLLIFAGGFGAVTSKSPYLYMSKAEAEMIDQMDALGMNNALVLADARMGNILPAHLNVRVVYGHAYETVNAEEMERLVEDFFLGELSGQEQRTILDEYQVDYVLIDVDKFVGKDSVWIEIMPVLTSGDLQLYEVGQ